jgi:hypothetical protein
VRAYPPPKWPWTIVKFCLGLLAVTTVLSGIDKGWHLITGHHASNPASTSATRKATTAPGQSALLGVRMPDGSRLTDSSARHGSSGDGMDPNGPDGGTLFEMWTIPSEYQDVVADMAQRLPLGHDLTTAETGHPYPWCNEVTTHEPLNTNTEWVWGVTAQDMVAVRLFDNREQPSGVSDTVLDVTIAPAPYQAVPDCVGNGQPLTAPKIHPVAAVIVAAILGAPS